MDTAADADLRRNILKALASDASPKASAAIAKALPVGGRPTPKKLKSVLDELAAAGSIIALPGRTAKFVPAPIEAWARAMVLEQLRYGEQPEAKIKKALTKPHEHLLAGVIKTLIREGRVFVHPALTAKGKISYGLAPADPLKYIATDLDKLLARAERLGFTPTAIRDAVLRRLPGVAPPVAPKEPPRNGPPPILDVMRRLEPRIDHGVAVPIVSLREALGERYDRASVDAEILSLARQAILVLHSHPWPARLSADQRSSLIDDGRGGWFDGAALRRDSI